MKNTNRGRFRSFKAPIGWGVTCVCAVLCCSWLLGDLIGGTFLTDLLSAPLMQGVFLTLLVAIGLFLVSMRRAAGVCLLLALVGLVPIVWGRAWRVSAPDPNDLRVRVGTLNVFPLNESWDADLELMLSLDLDVIMLEEVPTQLSRAIRHDGFLDGSLYPYWINRDWVEREVSPGFILSRYPIDTITRDPSDPHVNHQLMVIIHHPDGDFVAALMHPLSPRSIERWRKGNRAVRAHRAMIERVLASTGLEMIVGADLNSARGQYRARELSRSGLSASKPLINFDGGSFPSGLPGIFQLQLDDLWASDGVRVLSWHMLNMKGSDHRAVIATLTIKRAADRSASP